MPGTDATCVLVHMHNCYNIHDGGHVSLEFSEHVLCSVSKSVILPSDSICFLLFFFPIVLKVEFSTIMALTLHFIYLKI